MFKRPPYLSIALLSASALGYEILLMRLFSIIQWHHFAYMIIALALLGYGISGSLLSVVQSTITRHYRWLYPLAILLFALTAIGAFLMAQSLSFNSEELFWDYRQIINLVIICLLLALPFIFTASAICMTFMVFTDKQVSRVYAVDLIGAGIGALAVVLIMYLMLPEKILALIGLAGITAAAIAIWELDLSPKPPLILTLIVMATGLFLATPYISLSFSPYKGMMQMLQIKGTHILKQTASPLGYLTIIASDEVPLRHAPGMSLVNAREPPEQLALFTDAENMTAITRFSNDLKSISYLDQTTTALAYHLKKPTQLLVIGSGAGADLLLARYHQVQEVDALELNPQVVDLLRNDYKEFSGAIYDHIQTKVHIAEARDYLTHTDKKYDLIQIALIDAASASSSGLYALSESYLYTQQALQLYLSHLKPDGYLSITRWIKVPPRDTLKLFLTAYQAMDTLGLEEIEKRLLMIRNWQTANLLIKNGLFNSEELDLVDNFCSARLFDQAYTHRLSEGQSNHFNLMREPYLYQASRRIVSGQINQLLEEYKFNLRPASDDRPYFHHFFKWESFLEAIKLRHQGGMPLIEWGYIILILTLVITALLSALLILFPLSIISRERVAIGNGVSRWRVLFYFFGIGMAFLFIEIATIQKFILFLHHPIYAISISLAAFLLFAGVGSLTSERLANRLAHHRSATWAISAITLLCIGYLYLLEPMFSQLGHLAFEFKVLISSLLIAPLAFFMGMPFPLAISSLKKQAPTLIPWAWGINGYASVISAGTATLIAIDLGFTAVILIAVVLYISVLTVFPITHRDNKQQL